MTTRVKDIFDEARRLDESAQEKFVRQRCHEDAGLAQQVLALLKDLRVARDFLNTPPVRPAADLSEPTEAADRAEAPGAWIGRYRLLDLIGEGGFGRVFRAEQLDPVRRIVALKVIKAGMDTRQVVARFEQERQALALMDHPNIAKVLDAGATETGRPYFVMELVHGEPITRYCDARSLSINARLEVFIQVCHAVQQAHQKGIIHRDLKPSNILVAITDGRPVPKVIDFGIAKATGPRLTEATLVTDQRILMGTPEYMSPEQADMGGTDIDTRTDIYSLGVLLYELLTAVTPLDPRKLRSAAWGELQRMIREVEPPKPSTRLSTMTETLAAVAVKRDIQPAKLRGLLRGDLDWIVMKAIEKDRSRRYETANGLALDIARYLAGEPVLAAPPSTLYRMRKFVRRNRVPVTAGALIALVALLGLVGTSVALVIARGQRDRAVEAEGRERQRSTEAQRAAAEAQDQASRANIALALMDLSLGFADPTTPEGAHREVRDSLRLTEKIIPQKFDGRDQVQARIIMGQRLLRIDDSLNADAQFRKAIELMEKHGEADPHLMFEARSGLYSCASAGVHDFALYARFMAIAAAVDYLRQASPALGDAAAEYADATVNDPLNDARIARAARLFLDQANAFPGMTTAHARAVANVLHLPCPETTTIEKARASAPILLEWLEAAQRLGVDESTLLDYRHSVLKLHVICKDAEPALSVARDQLRATSRMLDAYPWQRMRYDSCAAHLLANAGNSAEARAVLIEAAHKARNSQRVNFLAARVLWFHALQVADHVADEDPGLLTEAFGPIDPTVVKSLPRGDGFSAWSDPDLTGRALDLISTQSVCELSTRRVLATALALPPARMDVDGPGGPHVMQQFVDLMAPGADPPSAAYARGLFELAKAESELGNWAQARRAYERGVECFSMIDGDDAWFVAKGKFQIGNCVAALGDPAAGLAAMRENLVDIRGRFGAVDPVTIGLEYEYYLRLLEFGEQPEATDLLQTLVPRLLTAPPPALDYVQPLLRAAALHPDLDTPFLEIIRRLARSLAVATENPQPAYLPELVVLLRQGKQERASARARDRLNAVLEVSPPPTFSLMATGWWIASVAGLDADSYRLADDCAQKLLDVLPRERIGLYERQFFSMAALRRGRFEEAIKWASDSDAEWIEKAGCGRPVSAALRACAFARLGRLDEAQTNLRDARRWARDLVDTTPLIGEAERLIESLDTEGRHRPPG